MPVRKQTLFRGCLIMSGILMLGLMATVILSETNLQCGPLALVNGFLIDGTGTAPVSHAAIVVKGGKVIAVGKKGQVLIPNNARVIDISGNTIMPGFINAHVHGAFNAARLAEWAQTGVTSVRDMSANGHSIDSIKSFRDSVINRSDCARLFTAGLMIGVPGGYGCLYITSPEDAREKVTALINAGVDAIKISLEDGYAGTSGLPMLSPEELRAIIDTAHERGKRVTVHITQARYLQQAVEAGVDEIAHLAYDPIPAAVLEMMVRKKIDLIPTFTIFRYYGAPIDTCIANLHNFIKAGGRVALGNDIGGPPMGYEPGIPMYEIECMQKAGMTPMEIIVAATRNGAHVCDQERVLGTLERGKIADILVVEGNPLQDLNALRNIRLVMKDGTVIRNQISP
jgi:imidazolonepropionase-like amidohydrolase